MVGACQREIEDRAVDRQEQMQLVAEDRQFLGPYLTEGGVVFLPVAAFLGARWKPTTGTGNLIRQTQGDASAKDIGYY